MSAGFDVSGSAHAARPAGLHARMLDAVGYVLDRLAEAGELAVARKAHAECFAALAEPGGRSYAAASG